MMLKKIFLYFTFICFIMDRHIDGSKTNYQAWIVIFLFWIALNTVKRDKSSY